MKKQLIVLLFIILVIGCKKEDNNKSSGGFAPQTNNVATAETLLVGHWQFDSAVYYQSNVSTLVQVAAAANLNDYEYYAYSTAYSGGSIDYKNLSSGRIGQPQTAAYWYVSDACLSSTGLLSLQSGSGTYFGGYIICLTSTSLVTSANFGTVKQGFYYYMHK